MQKTAYEMRISDWSSDVCSSDLLSRDEAGRWQVRVTGAQGSGVLRSMSEANCFIVLEHERGSVKPGDMVSVKIMEGVIRSEERRVGNVSVRVDLGGRRIIKKKKRQVH